MCLRAGLSHSFYLSTTISYSLLSDTKESEEAARYSSARSYVKPYDRTSIATQASTEEQARGPHSEHIIKRAASRPFGAAPQATAGVFAFKASSNNAPPSHLRRARAFRITFRSGSQARGAQ